MKVSCILLALTSVVVAVLADAPLDYSTTQQDAFAPPSPNAPSSSYGVPSSSYGPPSGRRQTTAVLRPSASYGAPPPSSSYGVPGFGGGHRGGSFSGNFGGHQNNGGGHSGRNRGSFRPSTPSTGYGVPSTGYGAPSGGHGGYDDGSSGPASYKFSYHVQDAASGNDFGHQESREGHQATGMYMVLLPDGRRQIVEYTADETGYHPIVRYEGTATGGGYPSGPSRSSGGYRY